MLITLMVFIACNGQDTKTITKISKIKNYKMELATIGGGCFWCVESCFNMLKGVESVTSGFSGGHKDHPTYEEVSIGQTGHAEVVQIMFDPTIISYAQLLEVFWFLHDPTTLNRQGNDVGTQYRSVIFYHSDKQKETAQQSLKDSEAKKQYLAKYVTEIIPFTKLWPAEAYHQGYYKANPTQPYCSAVVGPKIQKFKKYFGALNMIKPEELN